MHRPPSRGMETATGPNWPLGDGDGISRNASPTGATPNGRWWRACCRSCAGARAAALRRPVQLQQVPGLSARLFHDGPRPAVDLRSSRSPRSSTGRTRSTIGTGRTRTSDGFEEAKPFTNRRPASPNSVSPTHGNAVFSAPLVNPMLGTYFGIFASMIAALVLMLLVLERLGHPSLSCGSACWLCRSHSTSSSGRLPQVGAGRFLRRRPARSCRLHRSCHGGICARRHRPRRRHRTVLHQRLRCVVPADRDVGRLRDDGAVDRALPAQARRLHRAELSRPAARQPAGAYRLPRGIARADGADRGGRAEDGRFRGRLAVGQVGSPRHADAGARADPDGGARRHALADLVERRSGDRRVARADRAGCDRGGDRDESAAAAAQPWPGAAQHRPARVVQAVPMPIAPVLGLDFAGLDLRRWPIGSPSPMPASGRSPSS